MLYLIGLGLNEKSLTAEASAVLKQSDVVYLENYTVNFPYEISEIEKTINKKIIKLSREQVEGEKIFLEANEKNVALLVYGDVLAATTHISLIQACEKQKVDYKVFHNAGVFNAISETGLQLYKFGKTASLASWKDNYQPKSFVDIIKDNLKIKAHTLLLIDIGMSLKDALHQLDKSLSVDKIIVCSCLGTNKQKILYGSLDKLKNAKISLPFAIIIPSELHFIEKEALRKCSVLTNKK